LKNSGRCETNNAGYNHTKNYAKSVLTLWGPLQHDSVVVDIFAGAIDNAPTFSDSQSNISNRDKTTAFIDWFIPHWHNAGESGPNPRTPDISSLVQEVVDRDGWSNGNSMAFIMLENNPGDRDARTFDFDQNSAPVLHIEYFDATLIGTTTVDENGDWSVEVSSLSDGVHSIFATTLDAENNESNPSIPISYKVESQPNLPPITVDDFASTLEDIPVSIDVLLNDTDSDGTLVPSTVQVTSGPTNGAITNINPTTGAITYSSDTNFNGFDIFDYTVEDNDGAVSNTATVTITVVPVNDPPVATDDFYQTAEDISLIVDIASGVLANDNDVEGNPLTSVLVSAPPNSVSFVLDPARNFTYTPNQDFNGIDSFTYNATDGTANSNTVTATINVIAVPSVVSITASGGGAPGINNGDQTIITFSDNTNKSPVLETTELNSVFTFNQSGNPVSFGTTTSSVWQTSSILVITTTDATIPPGFFAPEVDGALITISNNTVDLTNSAGTSNPFTNSTVNLDGDYGQLQSHVMISAIADDLDGTPP